jgi:hypothetical protein
MVDTLPSIADIPVAEPETEPATKVAVRLSLDITNLSQLYQQLHSDTFASVVRRFELQLHDVLGLYNGQRQMLSDHTLLIDFIGDSFADCSFRAACCASLINQLVHHHPSPKLKIAASIHELSAPMSPNKSLLRDFIVQHNNPLKPSKHEILISQRLIETELQEHLDIELDSGKLLGLKPDYAELLQQQELHLRTKS